MDFWEFLGLTFEKMNTSAPTYLQFFCFMKVLKDEQVKGRRWSMPFGMRYAFDMFLNEVVEAVWMQIYSTQ